MVATDAFLALAHEAARTQGLVAPRIVSVEHPIGGIDAPALRSRAVAAGEAVLALVSGDRRPVRPG